MKEEFAFFGSDEFSITTLEELKQDGFVPTLVICQPDRPKGRGLTLTAPPIKEWALRNKIIVLQPVILDQSFVEELKKKNYAFFVVASYGKIIPQKVLEIPQKGVLNVHPSLLPKYRGPSPIESQILNDEKVVGVSIMLLDVQMDHGPILGEEKLVAGAMPMPARVLNNLLASLGGRLLASIIPKWLSGEIEPEEQDPNKATFTKKITKEDGQIVLTGNERENYLKFLAFDPWPGIYFFNEKDGVKKRIKITEALWADNKLEIKKVIPEGGKEIPYEDFLRGN